MAPTLRKAAGWNTDGGVFGIGAGDMLMGSVLNLRVVDSSGIGAEGGSIVLGIGADTTGFVTLTGASGPHGFVGTKSGTKRFHGSLSIDVLF